MTTQAQKKANIKYDAANTVQIKLKLNRHTDADIINKLETSDNKQGFIKALIRDAIKKDGRGGQEYQPKTNGNSGYQPKDYLSGPPHPPTSGSNIVKLHSK